MWSPITSSRILSQPYDNPIHPFPLTWQSKPIFCLHRFTFSGVSYSWNHRACSLLTSALPHLFMAMFLSMQPWQGPAVNASQVFSMCIYWRAPWCPQVTTIMHATDAYMHGLFLCLPPLGNFQEIQLLDQVFCCVRNCQTVSPKSVTTVQSHQQDEPFLWFRALRHEGILTGGYRYLTLIYMWVRIFFLDRGFCIPF